MPRRVRPRHVGSTLCGLLLVIGTPGCAVLERFTGPDDASARTPAGSPAQTEPTADPSPVSPSPVSESRLAELRDATSPARAPFCDLVGADEVRAALGQTPGEVLPEVAATEPGDLVDIDLGGGEVRRLPVAEYACRWELRVGPSADLAPGVRAAGITVFAPRVTVGRAGALSRSARARAGCEEVIGAPTVGLPGATTTCGPGELRSEGRVDDTWLACEITREDITGQGPVEALVPRLLSWCGHALERLDED